MNRNRTDENTLGARGSCSGRGDLRWADARRARLARAPSWRRKVAVAILATLAAALVPMVTAAPAVAASTQLAGWYAANWSAQCKPKSGGPAGSTQLGGWYDDGSLAVPACGPIPGDGGAAVYLPGGQWTPGWQCVELSERFLYLKYGLNGLQANGAQVAKTYAATYPKLFRLVANGTQGIAPAMGDVLSFSMVSSFSDTGHTAVVTKQSINPATGTGTIWVIEQNVTTQNGWHGWDTLPVVNWKVQSYVGFSYIEWIHPMTTGLVQATATSGWTVDAGGFLHPFGGAPALGSGPNAGDTNPLDRSFANGITRGIVLRPDKGSGYLLDSRGGVHPFGPAPVVSGAPAFSFDIARGIVLRSNGTSGYVLDGYGGVHPFGGAPAVAVKDYWGGWDIVRAIGLRADDTSGYVVDAYGGLHSFGGAPNATGTAYWSGQDVVRGLTVRPYGVGGYVLDRSGGVWAFGAAPAVTTTAYWSGKDLARAITVDLATGKGVVADAYGGVHTFAPTGPGCTTCY
jgi:hypothetical protein